MSRTSDALTARLPGHCLAVQQTQFPAMLQQLLQQQHLPVILPVDFIPRLNENEVVKLKLLRSYCNDFYGSVLWDMTHSAIEDVCVAWREGLRRVWDLPVPTHSKVVTSMCGLPQLKVELACRCVKLLVNAALIMLSSMLLSRVFFQKLYFPIGRNAHHCVIMVDASHYDIVSNTRKNFLGLVCSS